MEVKTNEGLSSEAVISKLTDASLYTVGECLPAPCVRMLGLMSPQVMTEPVARRASHWLVHICFAGICLRMVPHHGDRHRSRDELQNVVACDADLFE